MRQHQKSVKNLAIGGRTLQGAHPASDGRHRHHVPLASYYRNAMKGNDMAKPAATQEAVFAAADALVAEGKEPSMTLVQCRSARAARTRP